MKNGILHTQICVCDPKFAGREERYGITMENYLQNMKDYLKVIDEVNEKGPYKADSWSTMMNHKVPDWYRNAKFGIFIHWGVYSVPAFGSEWYPRFMYKKDAYRRDKNMYQHHIDTYGEHKDFGYRDFVPMFKAEKFDAAVWADLFKEAGARFVMPVAEHHDGFQMYDSNVSEWCASKKGPMKDIVGLLKEEVEKRDMVLTASSHRVEHYWFMCGGKEFESDMPQDIPYGDMYWPSYPEPFMEQGSAVTTDQGSIYLKDIDPLFMEDWLVRTCEIVDKYQPKIMYFDWWIQIEPMKPYLKKFMAYYYNRAAEWGEEVTVNYKNDAFVHTTAVKDIERGQLSDVSPFFWQNDTSVAKNSWCYTEGNDYKEPHEVICDLVDVVSKNGSLLLNVGPKADGTIPEKDANILREVGKWMKVNSEAIYDTFPFRKYGEGPTVTEEGHFTDTLRKSFTCEDFRFTYKDGVLYVFAMNWPDDGVVRIKMLGAQSKKFNSAIRNVELLGAKTPCKYILTDACLTVIGDMERTKAPVCMKITLE
ncbi:MAG: alpha-L-fucosidase [Lachnospiraceae bacterium]